MNVLELFSLKDTVSLVTGASGYLGREISTALAQSGSHVILQGRNESKLDILQKHLKDEGLSAETACFDLRNEESVKRYFQDFGHEKINILINNAYYGGAGTIATSSTGDFRTSLDLSLTAPFLMMKLALPFLRSTKKDEIKSIINIASMYGIVSPDLAMYDEEENANPAYYGAGKAGLIQLTKYAAVEFSKYSIRVNAISPGPFPSPDAFKNNSLVRGIEERSLLRRVGKPTEISGAILYLGSHASSYVTGSNLIVDGGWTVR